MPDSKHISVYGVNEGQGDMLFQLRIKVYLAQCPLKLIDISSIATCILLNIDLPLSLSGKALLESTEYDEKKIFDRALYRCKEVLPQVI